MKFLFIILLSLFTLSTFAQLDTTWHTGPKGGKYYLDPLTGEKRYQRKSKALNIQTKPDSKILYTGKRGGQYWINDKGNRVYVPRSKL